PSLEGWLTGIAYSPHQSDTIGQARASVPTKYAMRHYPDICHGMKAQFPNPMWDWRFAFCEARESIAPRPQQMASIFALTSPYAEAGFGTYSDGVNDDVNKNVWAVLGWNPDADVVSALREYARWFIGGNHPELWTQFADGLISLEND